jgi:RNA polymerase sigma factor (sigma-70 family)
MNTDMETGRWLGRVSNWGVESAVYGEESAETRARRTSRPLSSFDEGYLAKLRSGDNETAKHFNVYFRRMLRIKLWGKFGWAWQEEVIDEVMAVAIQRILSGEPRDASSLAAYVRGICANIARKPKHNSHGVDINFDKLSDDSLTAEERMLAQERARSVRRILVKLKHRDRDVLVDLFYNDLARGEVCDKYGVSREQLRLILFRARGRFQEQWTKH